MKNYLMEKRVYTINTIDCDFDDSPTQWSNEKFIREAEIQGNVYTLKEFEGAFNSEEINSAIDFIRIL